MRLALYLLIALLVFLALTDIVTEGSLTGVRDHIKRLRPDLNDDKVDVLTTEIKKAATKHNVNKHLLVAIFMRESRLEQRALGKRRGKVIDLGISQINVGTAKAYKLDKARLVNDLAYAIDSGAYILAEKKKIYGDKENWFGYYHSNKAKYRNKYVKLVNMYL